MLYLDIDGVLADFNKACIEYTGKSYHKDCWSTLEKIPNLFYNLDLIEGAQEGMDYIENILGVPCSFLGALPLPTDKLITAQYDKVQWIRDKLESTAQVNLVASRHYKKYFCKGEKDILIDDMLDNIQQWGYAGGTGILFVSWEDTINKLKEIYK